MDEEILKAEKRGYSKGYVAGKRLVKKNKQYEHEQKQRNALWNRAFIAALKECISVSGWTSGDKPINTLAERVRLARNFANEADKYFKV